MNVGMISPPHDNDRVGLLLSAQLAVSIEDRSPGRQGLDRTETGPDRDWTGSVHSGSYVSKGHDFHGEVLRAK
jgi:hypothetical protein